MAGDGDGHGRHDALADKDGATVAGDSGPPGPQSHKRRRGGGSSKQTRADGAASRARILAAAGKLFARHGYAIVSTRALAKVARVNLSAIAYHFGGKQGLYREVLDRLIADSDPILRPVIARLDAEVAAVGDDRVRLARVAAAFVRNLLGSVLIGERMRWQMALMLREIHEPSAAFPILFDRRIEPLHNAVARLVAAATGEPPDAGPTRLLTAAIIGQCMGFGAARTVICTRLGWDRYTPERVEAIAEVVVAAMLAALDLPAVERERVTPTAESAP
jgi:AcrR family transcriptional regulator